MMGYGLLAKANLFLPKLLLVIVLITGTEDKLGQRATCPVSSPHKTEGHMPPPQHTMVKQLLKRGKGGQVIVFAAEV